ncbi:Ion channel [Palleronia salina]|uniref:Ion channel n=2 Tax=Palleronia TaxID=315422 RepID=A0A1M6BC39_9RHOB|nr:MULTISPECIES: ion channel [Palleronia]SEM80504.1 Ion channel [Palleronia pelagia]SHI46300.1 Ion channel [Palleronia salina]
MTLAALLIGTCLVAAMGHVHHHALTTLGRLAPNPQAGSSRAVHVTFLGLLLLHLAEILVFALVNRWLLRWEALGGTTSGPLDWADVIYLTGVNFTTLGLARINLTGDIRIVTMLQSLGGLMLLTWSATYLFSVCRQSWREAEQE